MPVFKNGMIVRKPCNRLATCPGCSPACIPNACWDRPRPHMDGWMDEWTYFRKQELCSFPAEDMCYQGCRCCVYCGYAYACTVCPYGQCSILQSLKDWVCACQQHVNAVYIPLCAWMCMYYTVLFWPHVHRDNVKWVVLHRLICWNLHRPDRGVNCPD